MTAVFDAPTREPLVYWFNAEGELRRSDIGPEELDAARQASCIPGATIIPIKDSTGKVRGLLVTPPACDDLLVA